MKETIAFPQLVELVAQKASTTERMSELFLQELFAVVTQVLANGESVTIKGLGSFKVKNGEDGKDVIFTPDKAIAETVNAPFAQFEPMELCDGVTDEMLSEIDAAMETPKEQNIQKSQGVDTIIEQGQEPVTSTPEVTEVSQHAPSQSQVLNEEKQTLSSLQQTNVQEPTQHDSELTDETTNRSHTRWLLAAAVAIALIAAWYFFTHRSKERIDKAIETTQIAKSDTSAKTQETKAKPIVTDTIGGNNVLFTMAKKHYGDQAFWVYIARENQAQYPDYRKIPAGTVIVIPPAEKYGINSDSKQSLKQAGIEAMKLYKEVQAAEQNATSQDSTSTISSKKITTTKQSHRRSNSKKHYRHYRSSRNRYHRHR